LTRDILRVFLIERVSGSAIIKTVQRITAFDGI